MKSYSHNAVKNCKFLGHAVVLKTYTLFVESVFVVLLEHLFSINFNGETTTTMKTTNKTLRIYLYLLWPS